MPTRRALSETRRTEILTAAVSAIVRRGLCETRVSDIARSAGTSAGLVLYYFGSRDRLLSEALSFADERFYADTLKELAGIPSARAKLIRLIELSCPPVVRGDDMQDDWVLWLELWSRAPRDQDVAAGREALDHRWREAIAHIVREGRRRGEFGSVDASDFAIRLAALMDGLAVQVILSDPEVSRDRMLAICVDYAAATLGFEPPAMRRRRR